MTLFLLFDVLLSFVYLIFPLLIFKDLVVVAVLHLDVNVLYIISQSLWRLFLLLYNLVHLREILRLQTTTVPICVGQTIDKAGVLALKLVQSSLEGVVALLIIQIMSQVESLLVERVLVFVQGLQIFHVD